MAGGCWAAGRPPSAGPGGRGLAVDRPPWLFGSKFWIFWWPKSPPQLLGNSLIMESQATAQRDFATAAGPGPGTGMDRAGREAPATGPAPGLDSGPGHARAAATTARHNAARAFTSALASGHIPKKLALQHKFKGDLGLLGNPPDCEDTELRHPSLWPTSAAGVDMSATRDPIQAEEEVSAHGVRSSSEDKVGTQEQVMMPDAKERMQEQMLTPQDEEQLQEPPREDSIKSPAQQKSNKMPKQNLSQHEKAAVYHRYVQLNAPAYKEP